MYFPPIFIDPININIYMHLKYTHTHTQFTMTCVCKYMHAHIVASPALNWIDFYTAQ